MTQAGVEELEGENKIPATQKSWRWGRHTFSKNQRIAPHPAPACNPSTQKLEAIFGVGQFPAMIPGTIPFFSPPPSALIMESCFETFHAKLIPCAESFPSFY
jgi:hypothetical protein